jgi:hypothetical protein
MPEIQTLDSAALAPPIRMDATVSPKGNLSGGELMSRLRAEVRPTGYKSGQTQTYYMNGESNPAQIKLNEFVSPPPVPRAKEFFRAIQKWEGNVLEVGAEVFRARLVSTFGEGPDQEAEIYLEEVDCEDQALVHVGAVFYWTIGYLDRPAGRLRGSILRFRRLPALSEAELEAARREAEKLESLFE